VTGLYLLLVAVVWIAVAVLLARWLTSAMRNHGAWRSVVAVLIVTVLLPLPLLDEIIAKRQFEHLCKDNATIKIDPATAAGRTVHFDEQPQAPVPGTWVRVVSLPQRYVDVTSKEVVVSYNILRASGGVLVHLFGFSEGKVPLLFHGSCAPKDPPAGVNGFKALGIDYVEPPRNSTGAQK
jgi:hypothetical protein